MSIPNVEMTDLLLTLLKGVQLVAMVHITRLWTIRLSSTTTRYAQIHTCLESSHLTAPDLPLQPIHLLCPLSRHQNLHHLLLPARLHNPKIPTLHLRPQHPHQCLGPSHLHHLRRPVPSPPRLLGPQRPRPMHQPKHLLHRQPSLQRPNGLRHPHPPRPNDLGPPPRLARQTRPKRRLRPRRLRLLRQHLPHRRPLLDLPLRPNIHSLPSNSMDTHRTLRRHHLLQSPHHPRPLPNLEPEEPLQPQYGAVLYQHRHQ